MIRVLAVLAMLSAVPPRDSWFGADKIKHLLMSAFIQSTAFSVARAVGVTRPNAQVMGGVSTAGIGLWKEFQDHRTGKKFSIADLAWDGAGALAAAALLNGTR